MSIEANPWTDRSRALILLNRIIKGTSKTHTFQQLLAFDSDFSPDDLLKTVLDLLNINLECVQAAIDVFSFVISNISDSSFLLAKLSDFYSNWQLISSSRDFDLNVYFGGNPLLLEAIDTVGPCDRIMEFNLHVFLPLLDQLNDESRKEIIILFDSWFAALYQFLSKMSSVETKIARLVEFSNLFLI